jgi:hypothetical protein
LLQIKVKLWRHTEGKDWSAEINGRLHKHISTKTVDEMVEYVLVAAQQALLEPEAPPGSSEMPIFPSSPMLSTLRSPHNGTTLQVVPPRALA